MAPDLIQTHGWLLQKIPLANDDSLLIFLTDTHGKVKVFASKLQRSKTKAAELDYFRWLELGLARSKNTLKLRSVKSVTDFSAHLNGYERMEFAFSVLQHCTRFCPEDQVRPDLVQTLHELWTLKDLDIEVLNIFFLTKILWSEGLLPRFDSVRAALWVHPLTLAFTLKPQSGACGFTNHQRQMQEWFRRSEARDLIELPKDFLPEDLKVLQHFLQRVIENH